MSQSEIEQQEYIPTILEQPQGSIRTYNRWQLFFLDRLHRLAELNRNATDGDLDKTESRALKRAVFSTLLDCDAAGVGEEARRMMAEQG